MARPESRSVTLYKGSSQVVSARVASILRAKSKMSEAEIEALSDKEAWAWIYSQRPRKTAEKLDQICFTGFNPTDRNALEAMARESHLEVVKSVTKKLRYLCTGPNAGPAKLIKAKDQHVILMSPEQFENMLETGELPPE